MKHGVLKGFHPMIGIDFHQVLVPPAPLTPAPVPHNTVHILIGTWAMATYTEKLFTDSYGPTIMKGSDIGTMIPHIGSPSVLLLIEIPLSSSKCHFGSSKYKCDKGTVGVSLLFAVNLNLNCGTPCPTPTGTVLAVATHRVDMTWGDICAGVMNMASDWLIQTALQFVGSAAGGAAAKGLGAVYGEIGAVLLERGAPSFILQPLFRLGTGGLGRFIAVTGGPVLTDILGFMVGSPLGPSVGNLGGYGTDAQGNAITPGGTGGSLVGGFLDRQGADIDEATGEDAAPDSAVDDYNNAPGPVDYGYPGPGH